LTRSNPNSALRAARPSDLTFVLRDAVRRPGDIVIMDNLGRHKAKAVRQLIRAAGTKLFLPKYSPDLDPIEQVFAKHKRLLRKAAASQSANPPSIYAHPMRQLFPKPNPKSIML